MTDNSATFTTTPAEWTLLVDRIMVGDETATAELYSKLRTMRSFFAFRLNPQQAEDCFHDLILTIIRDIKRGALRDPQRLAGYAHTIAVRTVAGRIATFCGERRHQVEEGGRIIPDPGLDPEALVMRREREEIARRILTALPERDREVLIRFYYAGDTAERIQLEMGLTETQFRLVKSRAKARFANLVQKRLQPRTVPRLVPVLTA